MDRQTPLRRMQLVIFVGLMAAVLAFGSFKAVAQAPIDASEEPVLTWTPPTGEAEPSDDLAMNELRKKLGIDLAPQLEVHYHLVPSNNVPDPAATAVPGLPPGGGAMLIPLEWRADAFRLIPTVWDDRTILIQPPAEPRASEPPAPAAMPVPIQIAPLAFPNWAQPLERERVGDAQIIVEPNQVRR